MLGKSNKSTPASTTVAQTKIGTLIGPGAIFEGNISAPEDTRIDGSITGNCICEGNLIVGPQGKIKGNIAAQNVVISGKVDGDISSAGKLELFSTGRIVGNITARSLVIDEDAYFDGRCTMITQTQTTTPTTESGGIPVIKETPKPQEELSADKYEDKF